MRAPGRFIGLAYVLSVVLGNVCLIDITYAITPPSPADAPVMSKMDATECPWVKLQTPAERAAGTKTPCESGHCITTPSPDISCFPQIDTPTVTVSLPISFAEEEIIVIDDKTVTMMTERPPPLVAIATVVLRQ